MSWSVICGDVLTAEPGGMFHAVLCDPPYELGFMGKRWDASGVAFRPETWARIAEHLLPGAFLFAFGGTRTSHRLTCAIEDAGFEIRDGLAWCHGQGFPKSLSVGKSIDKAQGAERAVVGSKQGHGSTSNLSRRKQVEYGYRPEGAPYGEYDGTGRAPCTSPATPDAAIWEGYGTALKPAWEPVVVAQWPREGTFAANCLRYGAGAINVDGGRVGYQGANDWQSAHGGDSPSGCQIWGNCKSGNRQSDSITSAGRWPPNICFSHLPGCKRVGTKRVRGDRRGITGGKVQYEPPGNNGTTMGKGWGDNPGQTPAYGDADGLETVDDWECAPGCAVAELGRQSGVCRSSGIFNAVDHGTHPENWATTFGGKGVPGTMYDDLGTAARFFPNFDYALERLEALALPCKYQAKAGRRERDAGLEGMVEIVAKRTQAGGDDTRGRPTPVNHNPHPTVKPIALTRWLATLLLPPPEYAPRRILIPFAGSGSEMIGALLAGWDEVIGIEMDTGYCDIARARLAHWAAQPVQAKAFVEVQG